MLNHIKLYEGYFKDKIKELKDSANKGFLKLKEEFKQEVSTYVEMISDEFNDVTVEYSGDDISDRLIARCFVKVSKNEVEDAFKMYDNLNHVIKGDGHKIEIIIRIGSTCIFSQFADEGISMFDSKKAEMWRYLNKNISINKILNEDPYSITVGIYIYAE